MSKRNEFFIDRFEDLANTDLSKLPIFTDTDRAAVGASRDAGVSHFPAPSSRRSFVPFVSTSGTSHAGAEKAKGNAASQAAIVLAYIKDHPEGRADFQIAEFLGAKYPNVKESSWRRARIMLYEIGALNVRYTADTCASHKERAYCPDCIETTISTSGVRVALWFSKQST